MRAARIASTTGDLPCCCRSTPRRCARWSQESRSWSSRTSSTTSSYL